MLVFEMLCLLFRSSIDAFLLVSRGDNFRFGFLDRAVRSTSSFHREFALIVS